MSAGSERRVVDAKGRTVGNIYARLEEARKKRAKVLAIPKTANDTTPAPKNKTSAAPKAPLAKAKAGQSKVPGKDLLPPIKPPLIEPVPQPERAKRRPIWQLALLGAGIVGLLAYTFAPSGSPTVASDIPVGLSPAPSSVNTSVPPVVWRDAEPRRQQTTPIAADLVTSEQPITDPIGDEPRVEGFRLITLLPPAAAQALNPRPVVDPASFRTIQPEALLEQPTPDTIATFAPDAPPDLRISLNVPSQTSVCSGHIAQQRRETGCERRHPAHCQFSGEVDTCPLFSCYG